MKLFLKLEQLTLRHASYFEMIKNIALKYFQSFARKDIKALREIFDENVVLRDWETFAQGVNAVIDANAKIFCIAETIKVTPINVFQDSNVVIAELDIEINSSDAIKVVDVIEFTDFGKISAIRAFRG